MRISRTIQICAALTLSILAVTATTFAQDSRQLQQEMTTRPKTDARTALVIGNGKYSDAPLRNPSNDAADMASALKLLGFEVLSYIDLDQNGMKRAIREFGAKLRTKGGVGLFYYAGHGVQAKGVNYLIPVGAKVDTEEEVEYESVEAGLILAQMDSAKNGMNIVILDACRNNPFARSYRSAEKGLASIDAPSGTLLAYATAPGSVASDGSGRNGLYTQELLRQIKTPGLSIEDVFKQVRISVRGATTEKQTPWEVSSLVGNFYFAGKPSGISAGGLSTGAALSIPERRASGPLPPVEQILEKYFQAIGGKTASESLKTLMRSAEVEFVSEGRKGSAAMVEIWKAPNKQYSEMKLSEGQITQEGFDGTSGWTKSPNGFAQMSGRQLEVKKRTAAIGMTADLATFKQYYTDLRVTGREIVNDKETFAIEASGVGRPDIFYIDTQTNLLVRFDYLSESSQQKGVGVPTQVFFEEYGEVSGVLIPFVVRYAQSNTRIVMRYSTYPVEFNRAVDDSRFQAPLAPGKKLEDNIAELEKARTFLRETDEQYALKNYDKAIELCTKAIQIAPNNANGLNKRGVIYDAKGSHDKAIQDFSSAIKLDPYSYLPYFNRGNSYFKKREYALAIADFSKSIELKPWVTAYSSRAAVYTTIGQHSQALDDCSNAIELEPSKASLYLDRAVVYERTGQSALAAADRIKHKELGGK